MNNHYLLLLRKDDVIDLFRYGRWKVYSPSIKFNGMVKDLANDKKALEKLFKLANPFDYSIDYFLVHVQCPKVTTIEVDDIVEVFPLDKDSSRVGLSLSPEIKLGEAIFEDSYIDFQISNEIMDARKGVDNIFSIFDMEQPKAFMKKTDFEKIIRDFYIDAAIAGKNSIWYYLLRYERHQSYPKDNRGFALDAFHAFLNYEKITDMDVSVVNSKIGNLIMAQDPSISYKSIMSLIEIQKDFLKRCEKAAKGFYRVGPLFLTLKKAFANGIHDDGFYFQMNLHTFIKAVKDNYNNEDLSKALYLIGIVLGRENTYQYIYQKNRLPILKK